VIPAVRLLAAIFVILVAFPASDGVTAQRAAPREKPRFEVAAIRPSKSDQQGGPYFMPGGRFRARACTLRLLIRIAYSYREDGPRESYQILGGPDWIDSERFDIDATVDSGAHDSVALIRLQTLLEDRFKLRMRDETRVMPIFALVAARSDRTPGPRLRRSTAACTASAVFPPPPLPPDGGPARETCGLRSAIDRMSARNVEMVSVARDLSGNPSVGRLVIDDTRLNGRFDLDLEWTPLPVVGTADTSPDAAMPPTDTRPTIFVALAEQLGLKLESRRGRVAVYVIDSVERPAAPDGSVN
jgi:uncharacterized protein (TIGR03435 family)